MRKANNKLIHRSQASLAMTTITISDSEDDSELDSTMVAHPMNSTPPTPPPESRSPNAANLFYESRLPNDGRDVKPVYEGSSNILSLNGTTTLPPYHDVSIQKKPASTPIEKDMPNPFEYSMISDTSLQVTTTAEDSIETIKLDESGGGEDFLMLDETLVVGEKKKEERETQEPNKENVPVPMDRTLEDGEIIDVEQGLMDDSVVFVSEEILTPKMKRQVSKKLNMVQKLKEKAEMYRQKINTQNRLAEEVAAARDSRQQLPMGVRRRMVIIDGSNVAFSHKENGRFSVRGLELCIEHFQGMGFDAKAVVPQFRMKRTQTDDHVKMLNLEQRKLLIKTPSKDISGKFAASYDDRFILNIAKEFDAAVVSNDHYRDLLQESEDFARIISTRVIGYTWVMDKFFIPDDPYGKIGPNLNQILYVNDNQGMDPQQMFLIN